MINLKKEFGKKVRFYRQKQGLSQMKFAEKANITFQTLSSVERGVTFPKYPILMRIIEALDIPIVKLFSFDEQAVTINDVEIINYISDMLANLSYDKRRLVYKFIDMLSNDD